MISGCPLNLSVCWIKHFAMETKRLREVQLHAFLTSALCGGKIDVQEATHLISIAVS